MMRPCKSFCAAVLTDASLEADYGIHLIATFRPEQRRCQGGVPRHEGSSLTGPVRRASCRVR